METNKIIKSDCVEELKKLPDNSVDAIVTDPPYGLEFMGKGWDKGVPGKEFFIEMIRVLKPGGFLLSFGGTRTYHRMACGIEDAGFEIRDCIMWLYGSGFPKSLNIGKAIDKIQGNEREVIGVSSNEKDFRDVGKKVKEEIGIDKLSFGTIENAERKDLELTKGNSEWEGWGTATKPSNEPVVVAQKPLNSVLYLLDKIKCQLNLYVKSVEKNLELNQAGQKEEELHSVQNNAQQKTDSKEVMDICQSKIQMENGFLNTLLSCQNILEEISREMNKSITSMEKEMTTELKILNSLLLEITQENITKEELQVNGNKSNVLLVENLLKSMLLKSRLLNITSVQEIVSGTIQEQEKSLLEKDLKNIYPNCNPICMARKPLSEKNVALNVLKWGTGGINIDGCRVGIEEIKTCGGKKGGVAYGDWKNKINKYHQGRFPANIILDEEAGKMLDEQSGITTQGHWSKTKTKGFGEFGGGSSTYEGVGIKDKTKHGASRFFYCAKASKSERNFGCEDMEDKTCFSTLNTKNGSGERLDGKPTSVAKNNHPTVKPIKLMEYLIKLVSKEGAVVLDPFLGSGTTAVACIKLKRKFIGIEKEEEYIKIAEARIKPFLEQEKL